MSDLEERGFDAPARLEAVSQTLQRAPHRAEALDQLAHLTAFAFKAPICVISIVDADCVRFIGRYGLNAETADHRDAICTHVVRSDAPLELLNLTVDDVFKTHPVCVGEPYVRAYCGQPIRSPEGHAVGTIAVVDTAPFFRFSEAERGALQAAAHAVEHLIYDCEPEAAQSEEAA